MKTIQIFILIIAICNASFATNYYISENGKDTNNGTSPKKPFQTIQKAADLTKPGDTVFVMNGTYTESKNSESVLVISKSGKENKWIVYTNFPGHQPKLFFKKWGGIQVNGASYIEISGLEVKGNADQISLEYAQKEMNNIGNAATSGNGIFVREDTLTKNKPHHIKIINNVVSKAPGGGIGAMRCDYITISNNRVSECAFYAPYANSGISVYQAQDVDNYKGYKIIITNNISHSNYNYIPFFFSNTNPEKREFTDGNGIIIDDLEGSQHFVGNTGDKPYGGKTLIANNVVYNNGGSGIHTFKSANVDIVNNTAYKNGRHPKMDPGQIFAIASKNIRIMNNILYALPGKKINNEWQNSNVTYEENLYYDETEKPVIIIEEESALITNPLFIDNSLESPDFHLQPQSPCIDFGKNFPELDTDFEGNKRVQGKSCDLGAFEYKIK
ncbi:MAG: right-handed parallel beta-helix repeat-containing protein [Prolixibacteraceae bacterium]